MRNDRTTLKGTRPSDYNRLEVRASNPFPGSVFLNIEARWGCAHVDANELRDAIDKAVGPDSREPRPLTPDAITDEMVERARNAPIFDGRLSPTPGLVREMLTAALTEPPARPEGAEEIERLLTEDLGDLRPPVTPEAIGDLLASRGVRVVTEDGAA